MSFSKTHEYEYEWKIEGKKPGFTVLQTKTETRNDFSTKYEKRRKVILNTHPPEHLSVLSHPTVEFQTFPCWCDCPSAAGRNDPSVDDLSTERTSSVFHPMPLEHAACSLLTFQIPHTIFRQISVKR